MKAAAYYRVSSSKQDGRNQYCWILGTYGSRDWQEKLQGQTPATCLALRFHEFRCELSERCGLQLFTFQGPSASRGPWFNAKI